MPICQALVRLTLRDEDTAEERRRKEIFIPIAAVTMMIVVALWGVWFTSHFLQAYWWGLLWIFVSFAVGLLVPLITRRLSIRLVGWMCCNWALGLMLCDLSNASAASPFRAWTLVVLIMDIYLALNVPRCYQHVVLSVTAVFMAVFSMEDAYRLGLYDIDGFTEDRSTAAEKCECADPPCAAGATTFTVMILRCFVIFVDYFATRGFAEGVRAEQVKMQVSISAADQVAAALARFDLGAAKGALASADSQMPERLVLSFQALIDNLASYRPYLPQSCFEGLCTEDAEEEKIDTLGSQQWGSIVNLADSIDVPMSPARAGSAATASGGFEVAGSSGNVSPEGSLRSTRSGSAVRRRQSSALAARRQSSAAHAPQLRAVSLLSCNSTGFLSAAAQIETYAVSKWLAAEVQRFVSTVVSLGGLADLLSGDHLSASYGAVRVQGSSRTSATRAALMIASPQPDGGDGHRLPHTAAVCYGRALCGDFGSSTSQRFMVLGGVSAFVGVAERCAAAWDTAALVDSAVHADIEQTWSCRLRKYVIFPKVSPGPVALWEVLSERMSGGGDRGEGEEWMYELEKATANPWEKYNRAVRLWVAGKSAEALDIANGDGQESCGAEVSAALKELAAQLQCGAPAPLCRLTAAAIAGDSAPLGTIQPTNEMGLDIPRVASVRIAT